LFKRGRLWPRVFYSPGVDASIGSIMTTTSTLPLPKFLIIGAQKSGTRWLRMHLGMHSEVFAAGRELRFFNGDDFERGLDFYRSNFEGWDGEPIAGEATPSYMMWREEPARMAARIYESLPDVKLLAILRNPVDRTYSAFVHYMRAERIPPDADLLDRLRSVPPEEDPLGLVAGGWYAASLAPYFERFGDRLQVFLHEDVVDEPEKVYERALEHVGASPSPLPPEPQRVRFTGRTPENSSYSNGASGRRELTSAESVEIYEYFRDDVERLEDMLGRNLSFWKPGTEGDRGIKKFWRFVSGA
jgi:hypothetical protein